MPNEEAVRDKIKESYTPDNPKKKPATMKYIAIFAIVLLVAVLYLMLTKTISV